MTARRAVALMCMLPLSAVVLLSWVCEALGAFRAAERIDAWACPKIGALLLWVERGNA